MKRFYTRTALVKRATGAGCARATIGLIGLHIAQKTASRPQWIWSSFEQVDAVPPKWADWPGAFALNDATGAPMPERNPLSLDAARARAGAAVQRRARSPTRRFSRPPS